MRAGSSGELAGGHSSGWEGRLPRGMCPYVLGTEGPCLEILIIHFLNPLPHPTTSSRRSLSPQDPARPGTWERLERACSAPAKGAS